MNFHLNQDQNLLLPKYRTHNKHYINKNNHILTNLNKNKALPKIIIQTSNCRRINKLNKMNKSFLNLINKNSNKYSKLKQTLIGVGRIRKNKMFNNKIKTKKHKRNRNQSNKSFQNFNLILLSLITKLTTEKKIIQKIQKKIIMLN